MTIHAGKDYIASGVLSDHVRWVQHPTSLSRRLRTAQFGGDVSRSNLLQGDMKLSVAPRGSVPFTLTLCVVVDVLGSVG